MAGDLPLSLACISAVAASQTLCYCGSFLLVLSSWSFLIIVVLAVMLGLRECYRSFASSRFCLVILGSLGSCVSLGALQLPEDPILQTRPKENDPAEERGKLLGRLGYLFKVIVLGERIPKVKGTEFRPLESPAEGKGEAPKDGSSLQTEQQQPELARSTVVVSSTSGPLDRRVVKAVRKVTHTILTYRARLLGSSRLNTCMSI